MINIYNKIWFVNNTNMTSELSYMTNYEENAAFEKRKETGIKWAKNGGKTKPKEVIIDNTPIKGIIIGESVTRYATQNKLFRVKDPRGFTVELSTENISYLISTSTIINGVIQDECVWCKNGSNHMVLPTSSKLYIETISINNNKLKLKNLNDGDIFTFVDNNDVKYVYLGVAKPEYDAYWYLNINSSRITSNNFKFIDKERYIYSEITDYNSRVEIIDSGSSNVILTKDKMPYDLVLKFRSDIERILLKTDRSTPPKTLQKNKTFIEMKTKFISDNTQNIGYRSVYPYIHSKLKSLDWVGWKKNIKSILKELK